MQRASVPGLLLSASALVVAASLGAAPAWARSGPEMCHTVVDGSGAPVVSAGDRRLLTAGSTPCPQPAPRPEVTARAPAPQVAARAPSPAPAPAPVAGPLFSIAGDLAFDFDSARIKPEFHPTLDGIAAKLRQRPELRVTLTGHTDAKGSEEYNRDLSLQRAGSVADYLQRAGIPSDRLVVRGAGESRPVASNDTAAGQAQNRRVEIGAI